MFAISRMHSAHQPHPMIIFASYVPRSLTVDDAVTLVKELRETLGPDFPEPKSRPDAQTQKLKEFLMLNFKSETGNETPADCAIRLLSQGKGKK